jgi:hypothetical protein
MMKKGVESAALAGLLAVAFFTGISYALTPEQVLELKKAGVEDRTIRLMIQQEREAAENPADRIGSGEIRDKDGNSVIMYSTGRTKQQASDPEQEKADRAWKMLQNMTIEPRRLGGK